MRLILFELKESFLFTFSAIRANKVRTFLTMLGIVIGITSVVTMSTAIKGIDNSFEKGISALGSDVLYLDKFAWFSNVPFWKIRNRKNITMDDFEKFKEQVKLPVAVAPVTNSGQPVSYKDKKIDAVILNGSSSDYVKTTNFTFEYGRFYSDVESKASRLVCVIGSEIAKTLFPMGGAIDREIKVRGVGFRVVGVLKEQGSFILGSFNPDNQIFVPIGTIFQYFKNESFGTITFNIRCASPALIEETKSEAEGVMRKIRGLRYDEENDFNINQQEGLMSTYNQVVGVIQIAGLFITSLSLFVGAIGIMNIMFVSVKERTKEIGVRKALGARRRVILSQFLMESSVICLLGGMIGLVLAIILAQIVDKFLPTSVQYQSVVIAIFISLVTGVVAGFAPAYTAAKMDPVDALRYE